MQISPRSASLKESVVSAIANPGFMHHRWYEKFHMDIVEQISLEACDLYPDADRGKVFNLLWVHDYEKIVDFSQKDSRELTATRTLLAKVGFNELESDELCEMINIMNKKEDIDRAGIEIQIVSSADGASHLTGPFMDIYWHENPTAGIDEIQQSNRKKIEKDWNLKITIPEIRDAFDQRRIYELEATGILPSRFLQ